MNNKKSFLSGFIIVGAKIPFILWFKMNVGQM